METIEKQEYDLKIRIAGNTEIPCFSAIKAKGYKVTVTAYQDSDYYDWCAEKDNRLFSATSPVELLGLIAMWEVRGDKWRLKDNPSHNEYDEYRELMDNVPEYYHDEDGYPHLVGSQ